MVNKIKIPMHIAENVAADTEAAITFIPAANTTVVVKGFSSNAVNGKDATACLVWDYGETGEALLDTVQASNGLVVGDGDGIKKLGLILSNNETDDSVLMSADVMVEVIDK